MENKNLLKTAAVLVILVLLVIILVYAKPFLVPLIFAAILSMLLLPVTQWLQRKGINKVVAILLSVSSLLLFFALVVLIVSWQVSNIASDASKLEKEVTDKYQQVQNYIAEQWGVSQQEQEEMIKSQKSSSGGQMAGNIAGFLAGLGGVLFHGFLVLVYIFLFIYFKSRLKGFIVRLVPDSQEETAVEVVSKIQKVSQKYLSGLFMMIVCLWILYGIGFTIAGVKNAVFFAVLCGMLEIVPFVGNVVGTVITLAMAMVQGGGTQVVIGVLITYSIVQFFQTYILEPLVVGAEVSINPLATIVGLVAFEILWGIPGMILAIPLLGMFKIVCDHVAPLRPYAYLIGSTNKSQGSGIKDKIKSFLEKLKTKIKGS